MTVLPDEELILPLKAPVIARAAPKCRYLTPPGEASGVSDMAIKAYTMADDYKPRIRTFFSPGLLVSSPKIISEAATPNPIEPQTKPSSYNKK
ncbi:hypothetical protein BGI33_00390 [Snodgrassella alvi]|nr:hypothetical protein BGI34_11465 [Snodgrassella alvi]PIT18966.1 hypothetical protein BGI33_00390 [Snodgrassella alvi]